MVERLVKLGWRKAGTNDGLVGLLDISAQARGGGGYSSCHPNCGADMLSAFAGIVLIIVIYCALKPAFQDAYEKRNALRYHIALRRQCVCIVALIGTLFVGPVGIIVIVIGTGILWYKIANLKTKNLR